VESVHLPRAFKELETVITSLANALAADMTLEACLDNPEAPVPPFPFPLLLSASLESSLVKLKAPVLGLTVKVPALEFPKVEPFMIGEWIVDLLVIDRFVIAVPCQTILFIPRG
jgi:hypothetical protein